MASADMNESIVPFVSLIFILFYLLIPVPEMLKWLHGDSEMVIMLC